MTATIAALWLSARLTRAAILASALFIILSMVRDGFAQGFADGLPSGGWRNNCINGRWSGSVLIADCVRANGVVARSRGDVARCAGIVGYWPGDGNFYCGWGDGIKLPPGPWRYHCSTAVMEGIVLRATCRASDGLMRQMTANLSACPWNEVLYANDQFVCGRPIGTYVENTGGDAVYWPGGSWSASCAQPWMHHSTLSAACRDKVGNYRRSQIDVNACRRGVWNNDGRLTCM